MKNGMASKDIRGMVKKTCFFPQEEEKKKKQRNYKNNQNKKCEKNVSKLKCGMVLNQ